MVTAEELSSPIHKLEDRFSDLLTTTVKRAFLGNIKKTLIRNPSKRLFGGDPVVVDNTGFLRVWKNLNKEMRYPYLPELAEIESLRDFLEVLNQPLSAQQIAELSDVSFNSLVHLAKLLIDFDRQAVTEERLSKTMVYNCQLLLTVLQTTNQNHDQEHGAPKWIANLGVPIEDEDLLTETAVPLNQMEEYRSVLDLLRIWLDKSMDMMSPYSSFPAGVRQYESRAAITRSAGRNPQYDTGQDYLAAKEGALLTTKDVKRVHLKEVLADLEKVVREFVGDSSDESASFQVLNKDSFDPRAVRALRFEEVFANDQFSLSELTAFLHSFLATVHTADWETTKTTGMAVFKLLENLSVFHDFSQQDQMLSYSPLHIGEGQTPDLQDLGGQLKKFIQAELRAGKKEGKVKEASNYFLSLLTLMYAILALYLPVTHAVEGKDVDAIAETVSLFIKEVVISGGGVAEISQEAKESAIEQIIDVYSSSNLNGKNVIVDAFGSAILQEGNYRGPSNDGELSLSLIKELQEKFPAIRVVDSSVPSDTDFLPHYIVQYGFKSENPYGLEFFTPEVTDLSKDNESYVVEATSFNQLPGRFEYSLDDEGKLTFEELYERLEWSAAFKQYHLGSMDITLKITEAYLVDGRLLARSKMTLPVLNYSSQEYVMVIAEYEGGQELSVLINSYGQPYVQLDLSKAVDRNQRYAIIFLDEREVSDVVAKQTGVTWGQEQSDFLETYSIKSLEIPLPEYGDSYEEAALEMSEEMMTFLTDWGVDFVGIHDRAIQYQIEDPLNRGQLKDSYIYNAIHDELEELGVMYSLDPEANKFINPQDMRTYFTAANTIGLDCDGLALIGGITKMAFDQWYEEKIEQGAYADDPSWFSYNRPTLVIGESDMNGDLRFSGITNHAVIGTRGLSLDSFFYLDFTNFPLANDVDQNQEDEYVRQLDSFVLTDLEKGVFGGTATLLAMTMGVFLRRAILNYQSSQEQQEEVKKLKSDFLFKIIPDLRRMTKAQLAAIPRALNILLTDYFFNPESTIDRKSQIIGALSGLGLWDNNPALEQSLKSRNIFKTIFSQPFESEQKMLNQQAVEALGEVMVDDQLNPEIQQVFSFLHALLKFRATINF